MLTFQKKVVLFLEIKEEYMADEFTKCQNYLCGIGGVKCPCCNKNRGKGRAKLNRLARRKLKKIVEKDVINELTPDSE